MGHGGDQYSWVALLVLDGVFFCLLALLVRRLWRKGFTSKYIWWMSLQIVGGIVLVSGGWVLVAGASWVSNGFRLACGLSMFLGGIVAVVVFGNLFNTEKERTKGGRREAR